jgi:hypothetical protein
MATSTIYMKLLALHGLVQGQLLFILNSLASLSRVLKRVVMNSRWQICPGMLMHRRASDIVHKNARDINFLESERN